MALRPGAHVTFKAVAHIIFKARAHITPEARAHMTVHSAYDLETQKAIEPQKTGDVKLIYLRTGCLHSAKT
jgi:hypothetical protein